MNCNAELFPLPTIRHVVGWEGGLLYDLFDILPAGATHVPGPSPARCTRDPHGDPWHWDGHGTWWKGEVRTWR